MYQYQVSFIEAIKSAFNKYCCFTGRASRSEYWWFQLFGLIISAIMPGNYSTHPSMLMLSTSGIVSLILLLPSLGLSFRRLHDTGRSGWWILINLIPVVGWIFYLVWMAQPSEPMPNQYGNVPNLRSR